MWLLTHDAIGNMTSALNGGCAPSADEESKFRAERLSSSGSGSTFLSMNGSTAEIVVKGVITQEPSFLAMLFGGGNTTWKDINEALLTAEDHSGVEKIRLILDSPGGHVSGMMETLDLIQLVSKPIESYVKNQAASAAYILAAQTNRIVAENEATQFGSVGVVVSSQLDSKTIDITNTQSPNKKPDIKTEEGKDVIRTELDSVFEIVAERIALGRAEATGTNFSVETVNANFGQGGTFVAREAIKRGMIDEIAVASKSIKNSSKSTVAQGGNTSEVTSMNLEELKASHPGVYNAAVEIGVELGSTKERKRASCHLIMGEASGDMAGAIKAVTEGAEYDQLKQVEYQASAMKQKAIADRLDDDKETESTLSGANQSKDIGGDMASLVASKTFSLMEGEIDA